MIVSIIRTNLEQNKDNQKDKLLEKAPHIYSAEPIFYFLPLQLSQDFLLRLPYEIGFL
jgi:hypothetical protein